VVARPRATVGAAEVEEMLIEGRAHVAGEVGSLDDGQYRDYGEQGHPTDYHRWLRTRGGSRTNYDEAIRPQSPCRP
jgi:hypothetical protein